MINLEDYADSFVVSSVSLHPIPLIPSNFEISEGSFMRVRDKLGIFDILLILNIDPNFQKFNGQVVSFKDAPYFVSLEKYKGFIPIINQMDPSVTGYMLKLEAV